jgi:hypothetical protein
MNLDEQLTASDARRATANSPHDKTKHQVLCILHEQVDELANELGRVQFAPDKRTACLLVTADMAITWSQIAELDPTRENRENRDLLLSALALASSIQA